MKMSRREVLHLAGWAGLGAAAEQFLPRSAVAEDVDKPVGLALCIGLNRIDSPSYAGWEISDLPGCENDAHDLTQIAHRAGFKVRRLIGNDATWENVSTSVRRAALGPQGDGNGGLIKGDTFVVSYSGHGAQLTDDNGDEDDGQDESWCLFNGVVRDDNLNELWSLFQPGVRVIIVSDSCHSGTVARELVSPAEISKWSKMSAKEAQQAALQQAADRQKLHVEKLKSQFKLVNRALGMAQADIDARQKQFAEFIKRRSDPKKPNVAAQKDKTVVNDPLLFPARALPIEVQTDVNKHRPPDSVAKRTAAGDDVKANVLLYSACRDNQTDADLGTNGALTWVLKTIWSQGFSGSYLDLARTIASEFQAQGFERQQPGYMLLGADQSAFSQLKAFHLG